MTKAGKASGLRARNYLMQVDLLRDRVTDWEVHPFTVPVVRGFDRLMLDQPVTFLIGENGSGKSTLLEAIAVAWGLNPEGGSRDLRFATRESHADLHSYLRLTRGVYRS